MNRQQDPERRFREPPARPSQGARRRARRRRGAERGRDAATRTPAWRRRGPRLALVGALALAGVVVALIVSAGGDDGSTAFAVEPQPGGGVTIKIYSLEDASGLEAALEEAGIRSQITGWPPGWSAVNPTTSPRSSTSRAAASSAACRSAVPGAITISVGSTSRARSRLGEYKRGEISDQEFQAALASAANLNLDPKAFRPDQSVVISGTPVPYGGDPEGGSITKLGVAEARSNPVIRSRRRRAATAAAPSGSAPRAGPASRRRATAG